MEDWADRLLTLGDKAFRGLPETYANEQVVDRSCLGLFDWDAGYHVKLKEPVSILQAIQAVRKYHLGHGSMNTKLQRDSESKKETEEAHVFSINKAVSAVSSGADSNTFQDALAQLEASLNKYIQDLQMATGKFGAQGKPRRPGSCYFCGKVGHFKRECPVLMQQWKEKFYGSIKMVAPQLQMQ